MDLKVELAKPIEPDKIRNQIRETRLLFGSQFNQEQDIDLDSMAVWFRNVLPKYLWGEWKVVLKDAGLTWPRFLKQMKYHTKDMIDWVKGKKEWDDFIKNVIRSLDEAVNKN